MNKDLAKIEELDKRDIAASKAQDYSKLLELWDEDAVAIPPDQDPIVGISQIANWLGQSGDAEYEITVYEHNFEERKIRGSEWGSRE